MGKVEQVYKNRALIVLEKPVSSGDVLEIREKGNSQYEFTVIKILGCVSKYCLESSTKSFLFFVR